MNRFIASAPLIEGTEITLSPEESHHLVRVLRTAENETVLLVDGRGKVATARVICASPKGTTCQVLSVESAPGRFRVTVVFGLPKPEATEFILRRCTEVGVKAFQPVVSAHSFQAKAWNESRWKKILIEVCKQCESAYFPELNVPLALPQWLNTRDPQRILLVCDEELRRSDDGYSWGEKEIDLVVGAEGGWNESERVLFRDRGACFLGLGRNRLRTETAALAGTILTKAILREM